MMLKIFCVLAICSITVIYCESTTTLPSVECALHKDCATCIKNVTCLWCNQGNSTSKGTCLDYPTKHVIPNVKDCALSQARWGQCWLNFEALLISMGIIAGLLLILITWCFCRCCQCCCYKKNHAKWQREDAQRQRDEEERQARYDQRRSERQQKNDDIRRKYGLTPKYGNSKYQKFENED